MKSFSYFSNVLYKITKRILINQKYTKLIIAIIAMLIGFIIWWVTKCVKEHHLQDDPMLFKLKDILKPLHPDINILKSMEPIYHHIVYNYLHFHHTKRHFYMMINQDRHNNVLVVEVLLYKD